MEFLATLTNVLRYVFIIFFGGVFAVNLVMMFTKKKEEGYDVEKLYIGYMIVSLLAIITIKLF